MDSHVYTDYQIPLLRLPNWQVNCLGTGSLTAINRMKRALRECAHGVLTTIGFHQKILETPEFLQGEVYTNFVEQVMLSGVNSGEKSFSSPC